MSEAFYARVTCVVKGGAYAFDRLFRLDDFIDVQAKPFDEDEIILEEGEDGSVVRKNPKGFEHMAVGYRNIPCPGAFRVDPIERRTSNVFTDEDGVVHTVEASPSDAPTVSPIGDRILTALRSLDHDETSHWTADMLPRIDVVSGLVGETVTRSEIELAQPGFRRSSPN